MPQDGNEFLSIETYRRIYGRNHLFDSIQAKYLFLSTAELSRYKDQTTV